MLLSIIGNGLVLVISYRRRKRIEGLELLSVNLAAVDFLSCVCMYPLSILSSFNHAWMGNHITCTYYGLGCYVFGLCGMFTIASISVIRYIRTCYSLVYAVWLDSSNIRLVCCGTWLVAAAWSSLPLFGWGEYVPEPYGLSCTVAWRSYHNSFKDAFYVICSFALFTLVPILLIVLSQIHILYRVCHFSHSLSARGVQTKLRRTERRLSLMFFCISFGFVMAWAPYAVVSFLFIFHKGNWYMAPEGFVFPALFAKSSHIYNPFIYFYFNKAFRQELRRLHHTLCRRLGRNRVRIGPGVDQGPNAIQIELREQNIQRRNNDSKNTEGNPLHHDGGFSYLVSNIRVNPSAVDRRTITGEH
ncbi:opsin 8, group member c isoform X3 [Esox lucius]|uniref:opsin 8, group member c isoform X3 n=1 Tax=Esox lucius TaxID=8010 RepID=UPI00147704D3|nr:opsin 8, group member c isoform X3 [Esox lucius]